MTWVMVDVEADGPCPGMYSMIEVGAVVVDDKLDKTFFGRLCPITATSIFEKEALEAIGRTREETLEYDDPNETMNKFFDWVTSIPRPMFISDNNGFDWQFVNYYFWKFLKKNPFGHSSTNLGSMYKGMVKSSFLNFKHLRTTKHTHNALDDAMGNAEAMLIMKNMGMKIG